MMRGGKKQVRDSESERELDSPPVVGQEDIPEVVRFHRKKSRLTQSQLARLASVGKTVIFDIEKGKKTIRFETLLKVLRALNIKIIFQSPLMGLYLRKKNEKS